MAAKVSISWFSCAGGSPPAADDSTALTDSLATANITTRVTPITTPIAMRLERSVAWRVLGGETRRGERPNNRPVRRSSGGMITTAASARPYVNDSTPPKNATTTPSGLTSTTTTRRGRRRRHGEQQRGADQAASPRAGSS